MIVVVTKATSVEVFAEIASQLTLKLKARQVRNCFRKIGLNEVSIKWIIHA